MEEKIAFECSHCRYKFLRNKGVREFVCPYCGSKGTVSEVKKAQDWLNEVLD